MSRELKNKPLVHWPADGIYPTTRQFRNGRSGDLLLIVAFSGGGTRAAAFSYGVLEELRDTRVTLNERNRRLLDEVDILSGVSGGSFPAAYYQSSQLKKNRPLRLGSGTGFW